MSDIVDKKNEKEQEERKEDNVDEKKKTSNQAESKPLKDCPKQFKKIKIILKKNPAFSIQCPKINKNPPKKIYRAGILLSYKTQIPKQDLLNHFLGISSIEKNLWKVVISTLRNQEGNTNFVYLKSKPLKPFKIQNLNDLIVQEQVVPVTHYTGQHFTIRDFVEQSMIPNDAQTLHYDHITMMTNGIQKQVEYQNKSDIKLQKFLQKSTLVYLYGQDIIAREYLNKPILPYEEWKKKQKTLCDQLLS